jgi:hypothetical protein
MKLIIIFGPQAVGKMTVGEELAKLTNLKLFHNHMTIDLVSNFFSYGSDTGKRLVTLFRQEIFKEVANSDLYGLIFTFVWAFDQKSDWEYIKKICDIFQSKNGEIYFVELEADISERIIRNKSEHRLECKPTKRNIDWSETDLLKSTEKYRLNSYEGEITEKNYIKINNTHLAAEKTAKLIKESFNL